MADKKAPEAPKFDISSDDVKAAAATILDQGYVTEKDYPKLRDLDYGKAFRAQLEKELHHEEDTDYLYVEPFDFEHGKIAVIIFDMDQIPDRDKARQLLGDAMNYKVNNFTGGADDQEQF